MITRSYVRAELEDTRTIQKTERVEQKLKIQEGVLGGSSQNLRSGMGRRGANSNRGTPGRSKKVDASPVTPVCLFAVVESEQTGVDQVNEVDDDIC